MKNFKWTQINKLDTTTTYIAEVPGGFLIRTETVHGTINGDVQACSEAIVFVPKNKKE